MNKAFVTLLIRSFRGGQATIAHYFYAISYYIIAVTGGGCFERTKISFIPFQGRIQRSAAITYPFEEQPNSTRQIHGPRTLSNTNTSLVLKTPKTKTSVRKIFLPSTVAQMLLERKKQIDEMKELFGDEYLDYDLVFCHSSGRPMEGQVINRALKKLIQDNDLPDVVFHSFRHASITYKLKWNGGDMKSVQGDSGHARMDMVADVYSHIIDEDRRYNAQKFEEQFYNAKGLKNAEEGKTAPMPKFETSVELLDPMAEVQKESEVEKEKPAENSTDENAALLTKLLSNPETAALLKALAKTI